jgi:hypothetical protein
MHGKQIVRKTNERMNLSWRLLDRLNLSQNSEAIITSLAVGSVLLRMLAYVKLSCDSRSVLVTISRASAPQYAHIPVTVAYTIRKRTAERPAS